MHNSCLNLVAGPKLGSFKGAFSEAALHNLQLLWEEFTFYWLWWVDTVLRFLDGGLCVDVVCEPSSHRTEMRPGWAGFVRRGAEGSSHTHTHTVTSCSNSLI